jgi:hypothetical protein
MYRLSHNNVLRMTTNAKPTDLKTTSKTTINADRTIYRLTSGARQGFRADMAEL